MGKLFISPVLVFALCFSIYLGWGAVVGVAVLAALCHELGHLTVILLCRKKVEHISFGICGAVIETDPLGYGHEFLCSVMGPAVNLAMFFIFFRTFFIFSLINLLLALYNLLPVYPLDGGRCLRAFLLMLFPEHIVRRTVHIVSILTSLVLMTGAVCLATEYQCGIWPIFLVGVVLWKTGLAAEKEGY